jgi:hypothetical protein
VTCTGFLPASQQLEAASSLPFLRRRALKASAPPKLAFPLSEDDNDDCVVPCGRDAGPDLLGDPSTTLPLAPPPDVAQRERPSPVTGSPACKLHLNGSPPMSSLPWNNSASMASSSGGASHHHGRDAPQTPRATSLRRLCLDGFSPYTPRACIAASNASSPGSHRSSPVSFQTLLGRRSFSSCAGPDRSPDHFSVKHRPTSRHSSSSSQSQGDLASCVPRLDGAAITARDPYSTASSSCSSSPSSRPCRSVLAGPSLLGLQSGFSPMEFVPHAPMSCLDADSCYISDPEDSPTRTVVDRVPEYLSFEDDWTIDPPDARELGVVPEASPGGSRCAAPSSSPLSLSRRRRPSRGPISSALFLYHAGQPPTPRGHSNYPGLDLGLGAPPDSPLHAWSI